MKLAIYTTATTGYQHALTAQARKIVAALLANTHEVSALLVMVVTDKEESVSECLTTYRAALPSATVECIADARFGTNFENYKTQSQLLIAQMRTAASFRAIGWGADYCLSLDGDVLPPPNSIRCMLDMLMFDDGYYGVSFCPYPSHGGGPFLGGRGTPQNPILPDVYDDEKVLPEGLLEERDELRKDYKANEDRLKVIDEQVKNAPPIGNIFVRNGKRWRRRGWDAYPALGKGAMVPVDWTGCGCTMMSRGALVLCDWTGYDGRGTEDLFANYRRWLPDSIKMVSILHCPCDHIVRKPGNSGLFVHIMTGHELEGECVDHLRQWNVPWHPHAPGETHDPKNDGVMHPSPPIPSTPPRLTVKRKRGAKAIL